MADLPAGTVTAVENNSSALSDIAQSTLTQLTFGVNLTPLIWILLAELLVLGVVGSLYAIRLAQRRKKQMTNALSQMSEHYAREKNARMELQQKQLEEQFHLSSEKAAQASRELLENEQAFLSTLIQTLTQWDMRRLSSIHLELEQINDKQLIALASAQEPAVPVATQPDAAIENDGEIPSQKPRRVNDEIDLFIPDSSIEEHIVNEKENSKLPEAYPGLSSDPRFMLNLDEDIEEEMAITRHKSEVDSGALLLDDLPDEDQADGFKKPGPA